MSFLPITKQEMLDRGWEQCDFVYVIGDAYVDHHSFGLVPDIAVLVRRPGIGIAEAETLRITFRQFLQHAVELVQLIDGEIGTGTHPLLHGHAGLNHDHRIRLIGLNKVDQDLIAFHNRVSTGHQLIQSKVDIDLAVLLVPEQAAQIRFHKVQVGKPHIHHAKNRDAARTEIIRLAKSAHSFQAEAAGIANKQHIVEPALIHGSIDRCRLRLRGHCDLFLLGFVGYEGFGSKGRLRGKLCHRGLRSRCIGLFPAPAYLELQNFIRH